MSAFFLLVVALAQAPAEDVARLNEVNGLWEGARCRLSVAVDLSSGPNGGWWWQGSAGTLVEPEGGKPFRMFLKARRDALARVLDGSKIPAGTTLVAEGWRLLKPVEGTGAYLELRFEVAPTSMRVELVDGAQPRSPSSFPLARLPEVERYLREHVFAVTPGKPLPLAEPSPSPEASPGRLTVRVLGLSVQPAPAERGGEVTLIVSYIVDDVPKGTEVEVLEKRSVLGADGPFVTQETRYPRSAGAPYTSSLKVRLPAGALPGLYRYKAAIETGGVVSEGTALFEIR